MSIQFTEEMEVEAESYFMNAAERTWNTGMAIGAWRWLAEGTLHARRASSIRYPSHSVVGFQKSCFLTAQSHNKIAPTRHCGAMHDALGNATRGLDDFDDSKHVAELWLLSIAA